MPTKPRRPAVASDKRFRKTARYGEHGTPERWQHSGRAFVLTDHAGVLAERATEENILDVLALRRVLDETQVAAGLKLKADFHAAAIAARVSGSYSGASNARDFFRGEHERTDAEEAAYARWKAAVRELGLHTNISTAVINTVCHDDAPLPRDLPALQNGLQILARWYKLSTARPKSPTRLAH